MTKFNLHNIEKRIDRLRDKYPQLNYPGRAWVYFVNYFIRSVRQGPAKGLKLKLWRESTKLLFGTTGVDEINLILSYLKPGDTFIDIGANIGYTAMIASRIVGSAGNVMAFEAHPVTFSKMLTNIKLNNIKTIACVNKAVSSKTGTLAMTDAADSSRTRAVEKDEFAFVAEAITLDDYLQQNKSIIPNLIKIDVEGHEIEVLQGMLKTLGEHKPVIVVEIHYLGEKFIEFFYSELESLGYRYVLKGGGDLPKSASLYQVTLVHKDKLA